MELLIPKELKAKEQNRVLGLSIIKNDFLLEWATGTGKSLAALKIMLRDIKENGSRWIILCAEVNHVKNWINEIALHFNKEEIDIFNTHVQIICYHSLSKFQDEKYNLVLDEVHHAFSDLRFEYIQSIDCKKFIALSATVSNKYKVLLKLLRPDILIDTITLDDSIERGLISEPSIRIVYTMLNDTNKQLYTHVKTKGDGSGVKRECFFKDRWTHIMELKSEKNYTITINCSESEKYNLLSEDITYLQTLKQKWALDKSLQLASERKRLISNSKTDTLLQVLQLYDKKRKVVFTGSKDQAHAVGNFFHPKKVSYRVISSDSSSKINNAIIQEFNHLALDNLIAIKMLREGMNLNKIDIGFITQLDNQELSFVQMLGRCFRTDEPILYVFVVKSTQDEVYLQNAKKGIDEKFITTIHLDRLKTTLENEIQSIS